MRIKDPILSGILKDELERIKDRIRLLQEELNKKHKFTVKRKSYNGKVYYYLYLNRREGNKVVSEYWGRASEEQVKEYMERQRIIKELRRLRLRRKELEKILGYGS